MKKQNLILALILSTSTVTAVAISTDSQEKEAKSVAWFTANVRAARAQNKTCFENTELQSSTNCKNALHALELIYVGVGN